MSHEAPTPYCCPKCGSADNRIIDSRPGGTSHLTNAVRQRLAGISYINRRRRCVCGHRWTTLELPVTDALKLGRQEASPPSEHE